MLPVRCERCRERIIWIDAAVRSAEDGMHRRMDASRGAKTAAQHVESIQFATMSECANLFMRLWGPAQTVCVQLPRTATVGDVASGIARATGAEPILARCGRTVNLNADLGSLAVGDIELEVGVRMLGGKGGFGQNLRAEGGRISKKLQDMSKDDCRDLHGRRISTVKEAQRLAEWLASEPERRKALDDAQKKKYARLERLLGREPKSSADFQEAAMKLAEDSRESPEETSEPSTSAGASTSTSTSESSSAPKRKQELDAAYVEQSRENVERVRGAVAAAMKTPRATSAAA